MNRITIRKPDDWHLHVRDGAMLKAVLPCTARHFGRAIIMPNLLPPVCTVKDAEEYRSRIRKALSPSAKFEPLMTCYMTHDTDPDEVEAQGMLAFSLAIGSHLIAADHRGRTRQQVLERATRKLLT